MCRFVFSGCIFGLVCFLVLFCRTRRLRFIAIYICCNMVMERLICCDCCCMWIEFQASGVSCSFEDASDDCFIFLCSKCIRFKDLELSFAACVCCRSLEASGVDVGSQTCDSDVDVIVPWVMLIVPWVMLIVPWVMLIVPWVRLIVLWVRLIVWCLFLVLALMRGLG